MPWSILQMARNVGTSDATSYPAAQKHHHTSGSTRNSSVYLVLIPVALRPHKQNIHA